MKYSTLRTTLARWITGTQPVTISWDSGTWTAGSVSVTMGTSTVSQTFTTNKNTSLAALSVKIAALASVMNLVYSDVTGTITFLFREAAALAISVNKTGMTGTLIFTVTTSPNFMWMDQNAPRPALPYISGKVTLINPIGRDYTSSPSSSGIVSTIGNREFVLMLQAYGSSAFQILLEVQRATKRSTSLDALRLESVVIVDDNEGVKDISLLLDDRIESRAILDLRLRTIDTITDAPGVISDAEIEAKFLDVDNTQITLDTLTIL